MIDLLVTETISSLDRTAWDRCFPGELESYDYYLAVEEAGVPGFRFRYLALIEDQKILAVAPAFVMEYRLDTTVAGRRRRLIGLIDRLTPSLTRLGLVALGSPVSEICHVGLAPELTPARRPEVLRTLLRGLDEAARREGIALTGIKDLPAGAKELTAAAIAEGYQSLPSLPTAHLDLPFAEPDAYLKTLSTGARKDLRRKLKAASGLRYEWRHNIDDVLDRVMALYDEAHNAAELRFERLTAAYFTRVLARLGPRASCLLTWAGDQLVAFNLVLHDEERLIDKFLGMHYPVVKSYNLYYATWMANVRLCLGSGIGIYQGGQGDEATKRHLGCRFTDNQLFFRHRRRWLHVLLRGAARFVRLTGSGSGPEAEIRP